MRLISRTIRLMALALVMVGAAKAQTLTQQQMTTQRTQAEYQVSEARVQLERLLTRYRTDHPEVKAAQAQLSAAEAQLQALDSVTEERSAVEARKRALRAAEAQIAEAQARLERLSVDNPDRKAAQAQLAAAKVRAEALAGANRQRQALEVQRKALEEARRTMEVKLEELKSGQASQNERSTIETALAAVRSQAASLNSAPDQWWRNEATARRVGIDAAQQKKMDEIFQDYRLKLIDLNANLQKAELTLEPMMDADSPNERQISQAIDRVADARAELEKAKSRMALAIRMQLTPEQWSKLNNRSTANR